MGKSFLRVFNVLGGSLIKFLEKGLPEINTDWSKWRFFFCDERIVPEESTDSTFGAYKTALIGKIPITEDQFISVNTDLTGKKIFQDLNGLQNAFE
jgi:6-phosphogluconolactonase